MKKLLVLDICGRTYEVFEETHEENPNMEPDHEGLCDSARARISIVPGNAETVRVDTLLHEILHAIIEATGLRVDILKGRHKKDLEERIVTALTPALRSALKGAGWREPTTIGKKRK